MAVVGAGVFGLPIIISGGPAGAVTPPLSISISGNHFVNGSGRTIRLLGVNRTSSEYGCVDGFGYDDGHFDDADAGAIASWGADAVRVPLNEDCWLGINGQPNSGEGADPALTQQGYQLEIKNYVADLNRHGLYAILDLHWSAPGPQVALEQQPMPDFDHSPAFWKSVASSFKANPAVVFDLFNEPYDPTDPRSGSDPNPNDTVSWNCWETGTHNGAAGGTPCSTSAYDENNNSTGTYRIAGMQTLLDAVRTAGADQPVLAGGLNFANDLGQGDHGQDWLTHAPSDAAHQVAASFHNYQGQTCDTSACWTGSVAPVAAHVPVVTGEFDENNYDEATCGNHTASNFDAQFMAWADSAGVSYLAWGWIVESPTELAADGCSAYVLITSYATYSPAQPNGVALHDHLLSLRVPSATDDYNGDGTTDIAVFRPSNGTWYVRGRASVVYGGKGDIPVPGDYNGDGTTDIAVFRPSNGTWYVRGRASVAYGGKGDVPVPGDYNGDGTTDIAVFRPSNGTWYVRGRASVAYGGRGDIPVPGDYNGDGTTDIAVFRPSNGTWHLRGQTSITYGGKGDIPVPGDYNGDGTTDIAVFRPSNGTWYVRGRASITYGGKGDIPVPGDYNGDGTTDIAVFRPSDGTWHVRGQASITYGGKGDIPV